MKISVMRTALALIPLAMLAAPAVAAPPPPPPAPPLADPAMVDRMTNAMQAMTQSLMNLPVGQIQAAVEGRPVTPADRNRTLRDIEPDLDRDVSSQIAQARPRIQAGMQALSEAMPAMMKSLHDAKKAWQRAEANMPDPNYPVR